MDFTKIMDKKNKVMNHNVGDSDYSKQKYQPWDIWESHLLDPFRADIVKRMLRLKSTDDPRLDIQKTIHICEKILDLYETSDYFEHFERIRQIDAGLD